MANFNVNHFNIEGDDNTYFVKDEISSACLALRALETSMVEEIADYDATAEYDYGQIVTYNTKYYLCTAFNKAMQKIPVTGEFNQEDWTFGFLMDVNTTPWDTSDQTETCKYFIGTYNNYTTEEDFFGHLISDVAFGNIDISFFGSDTGAILRKHSVDFEGAMGVNFLGKGNNKVTTLLQIKADGYVSIVSTPETLLNIYANSEPPTVSVSCGYNELDYLISQGLMETASGKIHIPVESQETQEQGESQETYEETDFIATLYYKDDRIHYITVIDIEGPTLCYLTYNSSGNCGLQMLPLGAQNSSAGA